MGNPERNDIFLILCPAEKAGGNKTPRFQGLAVRCYGNHIAYKQPGIKPAVPGVQFWMRGAY
ncbi:MAG: hypothetical protein CSA23_05295 [Deltaproteobacteria bacterium]|nr:MAG: hypothetical protein CSA23_05295 [Deltaproteobacteria bacterium]